MSGHIESSDRGITINKSLAWTVGCGLVAAGIYVGSNLSMVSTQLVAVTEQMVSATDDRRQIELRVRNLEQAKARDDERFTSILQFLTRIDARLERIEQESKP